MHFIKPSLRIDNQKKKVLVSKGQMRSWTEIGKAATLSELFLVRGSEGMRARGGHSRVCELMLR